MDKRIEKRFNEHNKLIEDAFDLISKTVSVIEKIYYRQSENEKKIKKLENKLNKIKKEN